MRTPSLKKPKNCPTIHTRTRCVCSYYAYPLFQELSNLHTDLPQDTGSFFIHYSYLRGDFAFPY